MKIKTLEDTYMIYRKLIPILLIISIGLISCNKKDELDIPSFEEIAEHGYPTNEHGETYGPAVYESFMESPDLILIELEDGTQGYVKKSDLDAAVITEETPAYELNVYLQDGTTRIAVFHVP